MMEKWMKKMIIFYEETRDEIGNTMRPVFELKKLQEDNEEINYNFEFQKLVGSCLKKQ